MKLLASGLASLCISTPVLAEGDVEAGRSLFDRQCVACHVVVSEDGTRIAGRNARTGPNLYGIVGRMPGSIEGFRYSDGLIELGANEQVWTNEDLAGFLLGPTDFLRTALEDRRARSKMAYQVRKEDDAMDIVAFLESVNFE